jgi:hypothetical protein
VNQLLKGSYPQNELTLRLLGGVLPDEDVGMEIVEAPAFAEGDHVVLMLKKNWASPFPFVGDVQGAFVVQSSGAAENSAGLSLPPAQLQSRITAVVQRDRQRGVQSEFLVTPDPRVVRALQAKAAGR